MQYIYTKIQKYPQLRSTPMIAMGSPTASVLEKTLPHRAAMSPIVSICHNIGRQDNQMQFIDGQNP